MKKKATFLVFGIVALILSQSQIVHAVTGAWSYADGSIYYSDSTGKLGIGTTTPADQLQVVKTGPFNSQGAGGTKVLIGDTTDSLWINTGRDTNWNSNTRIMVNGYFDGAWKKRGSDAETWLINIGANASNNGSFVIQHSNATSGNNTISNFSPVLKINGDGTVIVNKLVVTNNSATWWADYVFDSGYQLKPLSEVASYINNNKHLPDVPTAEEVSKNGLSVADMQKTQMQKIEELTLYAIESDKKIIELEARLEKLEAMLNK